MGEIGSNMRSVVVPEVCVLSPPQSTVQHHQALLLIPFQYNKPLEIQEVPRPTPRNSEILVKITACSLCMSDIFGFMGHVPTAQTPYCPGHERKSISEKHHYQLTTLTVNQPWALSRISVAQSPVLKSATELAGCQPRDPAVSSQKSILQSLC